MFVAMSVSQICPSGVMSDEISGIQQLKFIAD